MGEFALGQSVPRVEDPRLLKGGGRYIDDVALAGMVHGYALRSLHAHAKILSIDAEAASAAPGVLAILTGKHWQELGCTDLPVGEGFKRRDGSPMYRPPYPAIAVDRVRWVGDCVAFVIAESLPQAIDAAELIDVEYEPLPAIASTAAAAEPGAPLVWDDCENNVSFNYAAGDKEAVDRALASADCVVRQRMVINRVTAATMEPRGCVGHYDAARDQYTSYCGLQRAFTFRDQLASVLNIPQSKLRIVAGDIGGSFGMKSTVYPEAALTLIGSRMIGRPIKWLSSRSDAFLSDAQGRDNVTEGELALSREGKFLGLRVTTIASLGAYLQKGGESSAVSNIGTLAGVYTIPAISVDVTAVFTNTNPVRPDRGNGRPEAAYIIERLVDLAADELAIDPAELRRRNLIPTQSMPYKTALTFTYDCGEFEKSLDMVLEMAEYADFEARRREAATRGKLRGIGISMSIERAAGPGMEAAEIRFDRAGNVTLLSGAVSQGQGHETVFKQIVCDRLGLAPDEVRYVSGDTDAVFYGDGTGSSRTAAIGGSAFHLATNRIVEKASRIAAHCLKVSDVEFSDGLFRSRETNRSLSIKEVARLAADPNQMPDGMEEAGLNVQAVYNNKSTTFPNGAHVCELEVDEETGRVEILRYNVVDDAGTVLNPMLLKGQIHGGIAQGVGQVLMENIHFDSDGQLLSGSFMDYAIPRAGDLCAIEVQNNPVPTKGNPLGAKGGGEAGNVGALPAVANALVDALSVYGVRHVEMPATPEVIWQTIANARRESAR